MSKSRRHRDDYDDDNDNHYENGYYDQLHERRKLKRMKNAIRARSIEDLMELDEEE